MLQTPVAGSHVLDGSHLDESCVFPHHCRLGHPMLLSGYFKPTLKASQNRREEGNMLCWCPNMTKSQTFCSSQQYREKREVASVRWTSVLSWDLAHHSASHLPQFQRCPELTKKTYFLFQRQSYFLGEATAMYTMDEIWRGKAFQRAPGPGFRG